MILMTGALDLPTTTVDLVTEQLGADAEIANGVGQCVYFTASWGICRDGLHVGAYVGEVAPQRCDIHVIPRRSVVVTLTAETVPWESGFLTND
jgi:hypothetical protein